jgi:hypothetical protein
MRCSSSTSTRVCSRGRRGTAIQRRIITSGTRSTSGSGAPYLLRSRALCEYAERARTRTQIICAERRAVAPWVWRQIGACRPPATDGGRANDRSGAARRCWRTGVVRTLRRQLAGSRVARRPLVGSEAGARGHNRAQKNRALHAPPGHPSGRCRRYAGARDLPLPAASRAHHRGSSRDPPF